MSICIYLSVCQFVSHALYIIIGASVNPLQGILAMPESSSESTPVPSTARMLPGSTSVTEGSDDTKPQLSMSEYFTAPSNIKEYDGMS